MFHVGAVAPVAQAALPCPDSLAVDEYESFSGDNQLRSHAVQPIHGPNPAVVTKELDLEEMEHANFDPEVAAAYHEDGLDEADLGYWDSGDYGPGHDPRAQGASMWQISCIAAVA